AHRSGLAGALGFDFNWVHGAIDLGGNQFADVAVRFKGNGTYLNSLYGPKQSFKIDLHKFFKDQKLGGISCLNFVNLIGDTSYLSDALAYEFFRQGGVAAPRTAYAWLDLTVQGQWEKKPLG